MVCSKPGGVSSRMRSTSGRKPEVEHLVGFVEHQRAHLRQVQVALPDQVEQAARGAHDHVDPRGQGVDLRLICPAAVERDHARLGARACRLQVLGDLDRQFPGRDDHQGASATGTDRGLPVEPLQQRDAEGQGLTGARPGLADDVVPAERDRQGQRLDGKSGGDAPVGECLADRLADAQVGKGWGCGLCPRCPSPGQHAFALSGFVFSLGGRGVLTYRTCPHAETRQQASGIPLRAVVKCINGCRLRWWQARPMTAWWTCSACSPTRNWWLSCGCRAMLRSRRRWQTRPPSAGWRSLSSVISVRSTASSSG